MTGLGIVFWMLMWISLVGVVFNVFSDLEKGRKNIITIMFGVLLMISSVGIGFQAGYFEAAKDSTLGRVKAVRNDLGDNIAWELTYPKTKIEKSEVIITEIK